MSVSNLATKRVPAYAGNYTKGRAGAKIRKITVHHMAGILSAEQCGKVFQRVGRRGSAHYGIGKDGEIANYVDENDTAWTDSNWASNTTSVTIENSNDKTGGDWHVGDATLKSLIKLVADIAKRNNLGKLVPGENLTWHSMYAKTTCPGDYLRSKMQYIADEANKINNQPAPAPKPAGSSNGIAVGDKVTLKQWVSYDGVRLRKTRDFYFVSQITGNRAVLRADSLSGPIYSSANTANLVKTSGGAQPKPKSKSIGVGSRVALINWVDYSGRRLAKTRAFYYVSELAGDRAVLRADSMRGPVYAAVKKNNLTLV